jgi:hypothetical protein
MVEMMVTTAITAVLIGIAAALYVYSSYRTAHSMASNFVLSQVRDLTKVLENTVSNATSCSIQINGTNTALKCVMPSTGLDYNSWGVYKSYVPASANTGVIHWGTGKRRWFYLSDNTGAFVNLLGTQLSMAERADDVIPLSTDAITNFTYYYGATSQYRWNLIDSVSFSVNSAANTVTYTINASDLVRAGTAMGSSTDTAGGRKLSITRTVYWRRSST